MSTAEHDHDDLLSLLLELCEDLIAHASPATLDEVDLRLRVHDITGGPGWLIDMLALARLRLPNPVIPSDPLPASELLTSGIAPHYPQPAEGNP